MTSNSRKGFVPIVAIVVVFLALVLGGGALYFAKKSPVPKPVVCTQEAKQCPDGSYVSRTGPNCEFAECLSGKIIFGQTADDLCGPQPPIECRADRQLGCRLADKRWDCYPIETVNANPSTPLDTGEPKQSLPSPVAPPVILKSYWNTKYGFGFSYPADLTAFSVSGNTSGTWQRILADSQSENIIIFARNSFVDAQTIEFSVIKEDTSIDAWLDRNINNYRQFKVFARTSITVAGKAAVEIVNPRSNEIDSYKLVVIKPGNYFIVIAQSPPTAFSNQIFSTITFTKPKKSATAYKSCKSQNECSENETCMYGGGAAPAEGIDLMLTCVPNDAPTAI